MLIKRMLIEWQIDLSRIRAYPDRFWLARFHPRACARVASPRQGQGCTATPAYPARIGVASGAATDRRRVAPAHPLRVRRSVAAQSARAAPLAWCSFSRLPAALLRGAAPQRASSRFHPKRQTAVARSRAQTALRFRFLRSRVAACTPRSRRRPRLHQWMQPKTKNRRPP